MSHRMNRRRKNCFQPLDPSFYAPFRDYEDPYGHMQEPFGYTDGRQGVGPLEPGSRPVQSYNRQIQAFKRALWLIQDFRAVHSNRNERINAQHLERIRVILNPATVDRIKDSMSNGPEGTIGISEFVGLNSDKLGPDDEFLKALRMALTNGDRNGFLTGENLCEFLLAKGIRLSLRETEEMVTAVDSFGLRAVRPNDLELVINALV